jgi:hypothetical protein
MYKTITLSAVLYGCGAWSLTLRDEQRLRLRENRVLRRIFGPKRDEVTGEWRKLHNEELRDLYPSTSIIRIIKLSRMRWAGHVAQMGKKRNAYRLLLGKREGKKPQEDQDGGACVLWNGMLWTGLIWLRKGTNGGLL